MPISDKKRITDPVHGTIELSPLELEVISSPAFQRLRNVKQLGLAHLVYPGADYSRFSHSIGVCHVTGRILTALRDRAGVTDISDEEMQRYRLAALLHDVGHYPFSHAMERAIENYHKKRLYQPKQSTLDLPDASSSKVPQKILFLHEDLSEKILESDSLLPNIFSKHHIKPEDIYSIILRTRPGRFSNLVSSDLDADRIDYLLRTSHFTGLHYGSVDIDYLVTQLRVDTSNHICLTNRALRAADHLLLARYFDYQQVNYHKTVAAFELLLEDALEILMREGAIECSADAVSQMIANGEWSSFDDLFVLSKMRDHYIGVADPIAKQKLWSLLNRCAPKLVADFEYLGKREDSTKNQFKAHKRLVKEHIPQWAKQFGLPEDVWYLWDRPGITLTKVGSRYRDEEDPDKIEQSVQILDRDGKTSKPIARVQNSLMSVLADHALYALRVYVLLKPGQEDIRVRIRQAIKTDLHEIEWK